MILFLLFCLLLEKASEFLRLQVKEQLELHLLLAGLFELLEATELITNLKLIQYVVKIHRFAIIIVIDHAQVLKLGDV